MKLFNFKLKNSKKMRPLTKNEFILITTLFLGIGAYFSINYLLLPKWNLYQKTQQELKTVKAQYESTYKDFKNLSKIKEQKVALKYQLSELSKNLPPYISEEDIILTIGKYGKENTINIQSITLEKENSSKASNFINSSDKALESEQSQNNKENNDGKKENSKENNNDKAKSSKEGSNSDEKSKEGKRTEEFAATVLTKYVTVTFSGKLENLYSFIDKFEKNDKKLAFKEMALNKDKGELISGTMRFQYIGYKDQADRARYNLEVPQVDGKITPFEGGERWISTSNKSEVEGNFSITLNKYDAESPKFAFGEYRKVETEIYNNTNGEVNGKFTIEEEKVSEKFLYSYSLGSNTKTEKKSIELSNGKIILKVYSNPRNKSEDIMKLNLDVENKTDYPLEIYVLNDDIQNPRFLLRNKSGNVYIKQLMD